MKQSIIAVTLGVADLARTRAFYTDGLGWAPVMELDEVVFYQAGFGLLLALWGFDDLQGDVGTEITAGSGFSLGHNVDSPAEVDEVIERARAAGAAILKEPQPAPLFNGYQGYFADPDGHLWDVAYNPGLFVDQDGTPVFRSAAGS
jgi:catechol 2,3-dioxygenase-like lactoylglutathione lyase family enzyme